MHREVIEAEEQIIKLFNIKSIEKTGRFYEGCEINKLEEILENLIFQYDQHEVRKERYPRAYR